jgi:hypothetical protein
MTQTLESPQFNAAMAAQTVAANLRVIRGCRDVEISPDEPGDHVVEILRDDIDSAIARAIAAESPEGELELMIADCCDFTAKAMFLSMTEPPQRAVERITELASELRDNLRERAADAAQS